MSAPRVEKRRKKEFAAELLARARASIPDWELDPAARDFGMALLDIAARFDSEVAERLDRTGEKNRRGLLDWLGIQGQAARAARVPVVLRLGERTPNPVAAPAPVKLRADTAAGPVVFETETDITLVPGRLATLVAVDPADDALYLPPPGIDNVEPQPVLPDSWRTKAFAPGGAARLQLDPALGLDPGMLLLVGGHQYQLTEVDKDIVTFDPPLPPADGIDAGTVVTKVASFAPFDGQAQNRQAHVLYLGDDELLDIKAKAVIEVAGMASVAAGVRWEYWGKLEDGSVLAWQPLHPAANRGAVLALEKPHGSIEPRAVGGIESRWIRAALGKQLGAAATFDQLQLRVSQGTPADPAPPDPAAESPEIEGVANTTPQLLDGVFYPFGREPRLFDTFYLGCTEAFSKKLADVTLSFDLADPSMRALTVVPLSADAAPVLAAAAQDGYLHLLKVERDKGKNGIVTHLRPPVQPPSPPDGGGVSGQAPRPLDRAADELTAARPAAWASGAQFSVAVAARSQVWVWHERESVQELSKDSGWQSYGEVASDMDAKFPITDLVAAPAFNALFALRGGRLFRHALPPEGKWEAVELLEFDPRRKLVGLAPVRRIAPDGSLSEGNLPALCALLGDDGKDAAEACIIWFSRDKLTARWSTLPGMDRLNSTIRPVALQRQVGDTTIEFAVAAVMAGADQLAGFRSMPFEAGVALPSLPRHGKVAKMNVGGPVIGRDLDAAMRTRDITVFAATEHALMAGTPFLDEPPESMVASAIPADAGIAGGAPVVIPPSHVGVPGTRSDLLLGKIEQAGRIDAPLAKGDFSAALLVETSDSLDGETFAFEFEATDGTGIEVVDIIETPVPTPFTDKKLYRLKSDKLDIPKPNGALWLFAKKDPQTSAERITGDDALRKLSVTDPNQSLAEGAPVLLTFAAKVGDQVNRIKEITEEADGTRTIEFTNNLLNKKGKVDFRVQHAGIGRMQMLPLLTLNETASAKWSPALLHGRQIVLPDLHPDRQDTVTVGEIAGPRQLLLLLPWTQSPKLVTAYVEVPTIDWQRQLGETADNPELSWEYWNGSGWWKLKLVGDQTANFQRSGMLAFKVPKDLQASEWAGKTNFWIRARLVGGDYGREIITAVSEQDVDPKKTTRQKVVRDATEIHAPAVLHLSLHYTMPETTPAYLITEDSGTTRDQSAANRTAGAIVEAFPPLGAMLARLDGAAAKADDGCGARAGGAKCGCATCASSPDAAGTAGAGAAAGRALYLGFDARLKGEPVNILLLPSDERNFDDFAPARVDVLRGDRFEPVVASDATRALGEAGILSIALASAPAPAELFGRTLTWLRIRPREGSVERDWKPALRGAYLNAVWAQAAETQEFEMLGSSQGAPFQQVLLARPPVLQDTLELRVREPLGEEERAALLRDDPDKVLSAVEGQPGDWVLWKLVVDPADEDARSRVYGLDEGSGLIWFGDGVHGAIAPIGRDAIMAFRYRRTDVGAEPGAAVPASMVGAGSSLSIVTPLQGAEAAFAADQAAGGSPAEDIARVLRLAPAHLRQRGAAVTAGDLEDMALSLVPQAAQARCLLRGPAVQLVLVMQGAEPRPASAVKRQLRRMLLDAAAPALAAPGVFTILDPVPVPFHVRVELATATLDHSATLADSAKRAVAALFDSASGGRDGQGWQLGARPSATDIAACLLDLPYVDDIRQVTLAEKDAEGLPKPLRTTLAATELAQLAADGIELQFIVPQETP
jgi:hypothetical protein